MSKGLISPKSSVPPSNLMAGLVRSVAPRMGEGQPVKISKISHSDGKTVSFGADFSQAPVPARRYAADICDLVIHRNDLVFVFGQESVFGGEVDSVLQLRMNPTSAQDFLHTLSNGESAKYTETVGHLKINPEPLTTIGAKPSKEAKAQVTYACVAISGFDSCIDFYSASPFAMAHLKDHGDLYVEPVARVDLHTALFLSLVSRLNELVPALNQLS